MTSNTTVRRIPIRRRTPGSSPAATAPGEITRCNTVCASCNLRELCAPCCKLSGPERKIAERLPFTRIRVRRGDYLYRAGDRFSALYAVRQGFFKSLTMIENGREQVTGFSMAGEVLGLDGIAPERYGSNAVALEDSEVCAIGFPGLLALTRELPSLQGQFYRMMSREIAREQGMMLQLGSMNAEERLAMFLLNLSRRFAARGDSASDFHLRMTREEIGSYLGLKLETISRTLSLFHEQGLIAVQQKFVRILDRAGLEGVLGRVLG
jgi:CRP/FNR family transcriptional regulator, anaerobic regulatory protein